MQCFIFRIAQTPEQTKIKMDLLSDQQTPTGKYIGSIMQEWLNPFLLCKKKKAFSRNTLNFPWISDRIRAQHEYLAKFWTCYSLEMGEVRHTRLQICRHKMSPLKRRDWTRADMTVLQTERCMHKKFTLSTAVCHSGSLSGAAGTLSWCQNCNPLSLSLYKTSTGPSGP